MNDTICFDIETVPIEANEAPPGYMVGIGKKKKINPLSRPELNKVICIGFYDGESFDFIAWSQERPKKEDFGGIPVRVHASEEKTLFDVAAVFGKKKKIIGFNINSFDMRILKFRSALHRIKMPFPWDIKPWSERHIDLRHLLSGGDRFYSGTLGDFHSILCPKSKEVGWKIEKEEIYPLWKKGNLISIIEGCRSDLIKTFELADAMGVLEEERI